MSFDLPAQHAIAHQPQQDKISKENQKVDVQLAVLDVEFFEHLLASPEYALFWVLFVALQRPPVHAVQGEDAALEAVAYIGDVGHELEVPGDRVKGHKESREEQDGDGRDGADEDCHLGGKNKHNIIGKRVSDTDPM